MGILSAIWNNIIEIYGGGIWCPQNHCEKPKTKNYNTKQDDDKEGNGWEDDIGPWCMTTGAWVYYNWTINYLNEKIMYYK